MISVIAKIGLAALCLLCLLDMPYGYFQLVRWMALLVFAGLAWEAYEKGKQLQVGLWLGLAVLFQPLLKIALGRTLWNVVDVAVAVLLLASVWWEARKKRD
jgi:predicted membrane protein